MTLATAVTTCSAEPEAEQRKAPNMSADIPVEAPIETEEIVDEELLVEEALADESMSAEDVDDVFAEDDPLPMTTIDLEEDLDEDPVEDYPDAEEEPDEECGVDPDDPGAEPA